MSTEELPERESMEFDVVIVGAGPSGLTAAIRLKQLNADLTIVVVEKGSEVGAHILSGAVIDPLALDKLIPDWRSDDDCPLKTQVKDDKFFWMTESGAIKLPGFAMPPFMDNHHCYIGSLGNVCRWLSRKAEALGVEIYPGFAATEVLYDEQGAVRGIATGDMGIGKDGKPKASFTRGMELLGKYTLFAEGARGSLSKQLIAKFALDAKSEPPKFGIGLKEVWQIDPAKHQKGLIQHSFGWPLDMKTGGGSFLYHYYDNLVAVGFVVHLNYDDREIAPVVNELVEGGFIETDERLLVTKALRMSELGETSEEADAFVSELYEFLSSLTVQKLSEILKVVNVKARNCPLPQIAPMETSPSINPFYGMPEDEFSRELSQ